MADFLDPIPGVIPFGTVTIFAGAPGVGKTAMLAEWIQRWHQNRTICGHPTNPPTNFYFIAGDRQWASHQKWFDLVEFPDINHYSLADDPAINLEDIRSDSSGATLFDMAINRLDPQPGGHLFVDPVSPLFITGNQNRSRDVAASLLGFSRIAQARQINITMTAHFAKQKGDHGDRYTRPQDRISGSGSFSGFSDTQIYLVDPEGKQDFHLMGWTPRHRPPEEFKFTRDTNGLFIPYRSLEDVGDGEGSTTPAPAPADDLTSLGRLYRLLVDLGPTHVGELLIKSHLALQLSRATFYRLMRILRHEGRIIVDDDNIAQAKPTN